VTRRGIKTDFFLATWFKRRRKELNLKGSGAMQKEMPLAEAEQLVLDQMAEDPAKHHGVRTIQHKMAFTNSVHLPRWCKGFVTF
jgi:hypothetical protein